MNIIQVLPSLTVGGPTYSVPALCRSIQNIGNNVTLHMEETDVSSLSDINVVGYKCVKAPLLSQLGFSLKMYRQLHEYCKTAEIIQTNSLWMYSNFITEFARRNTKAKSVIMPRGTLSEYALSISKWKKSLVGILGQNAALKNADLFIATCEMEYRDIRKYGLTAPVAIIPNGIDIPVLPTNIKKKKRVVFLSRIHKKKGVDVLIDAWREIEQVAAYNDWFLSIVGPMSSYAHEMLEYAALKGCKRIEFTGGIQGEDKFKYLSESSFFVLPTHSENFGIAVAEALACGIPAICTKGAPWEGLESNACGKWITLSQQNLVKAISNMIEKSPEELLQMGQNGRQWMERDFSWKTIAEHSVEAFNYIINPQSEPCPIFVHLD